MKTATKRLSFLTGKTVLPALGLLAGLLMLQPGDTEASVSGGATIFNEATVTYSTPTLVNKTAKGSTSVTVSTKSSAPYATVTPLTQTTGEGSTVTYTYSIINRSNGVNDLTVASPPTIAPNLINAATTNSLASYSFSTMWGGVILTTTKNGTDSTITLPAGTVGGLTVNTTTVAIVGGTGTVYYYTVTGKDPGVVPSATAGETPATVTLTPVSGTPLLDSTIAPAGTVIGEFRTVVYTQTTGTLTTAADGTYKTNITVTADAGSGDTSAYSTKPADNNETTTTVKKNPVSVQKTADNTSYKPGDTITYTVVVTNNTSSDTTAATIADPLSPYVTYTAGTTTLNGNAVADNGSAPLFPLSGAGISINSPTKAAGVITANGGTATIVYKVTVN